MNHFPILLTYEQRKNGWPRTIPWDTVEPWRKQAEYNHQQTLERLAERGGLDPLEMWLAAHNRNLFNDDEGLPEGPAGLKDWLLGMGVA